MARRTVQASARSALNEPGCERLPDARRLSQCGKFSIATNGKFSFAIDTGAGFPAETPLPASVPSQAPEMGMRRPRKLRAVRCRERPVPVEPLHFGFVPECSWRGLGLRSHYARGLFPMINGGEMHPFAYDSTWPLRVQELFRKAVYRLHHPTAVENAVNPARELVMLDDVKAPAKDVFWALKLVLHKFVHHKVINAHEYSDDEHKQLVTTMLVLLNYALIDKYGLKGLGDVTPCFHNPDDQEAHDRNQAACRAEHAAAAVRVLAGWRRIAAKLSRKNWEERKRAAIRVSGELTKPIPAAIPVISMESLRTGEGDVQFVWNIGLGAEDRVCTYQYFPNRGGWSVQGSVGEDRFSGDGMEARRMAREAEVASTGGIM